jgi:hypothetical protein
MKVEVLICRVFPKLHGFHGLFCCPVVCIISIDISFNLKHYEQKTPGKFICPQKL